MYKTKYILPFTNDLDELYEIYLDFLNYEGDIMELVGTDDCLTIRSTAGDENKLEPILGTEALINIFVDEKTSLTIADLIAEHDNDIRVTIYRDEDYSKSIFQGFVVVEDNSQPFLDPPYILSVRALDGLGLLKGVDLVDTNALRFVGTFSVLSWIAQILYKTGQTLNLRVYFNFMESSFAANIGALEQVYLSSITFSQGDAFNVASNDPTIDINATTADDCYTALEKIVRCFRCRLFQEDGRWNLVSLYEYLNPAGFSFKEYTLGDPIGGIVRVTPVDTGSSIDYTVAIGKNEIVHPVAEDQIIYLKLATKWIKLTYTYDQSQNKVCNQDLSEGDRNNLHDEIISSSVIDSTITPVVSLQTNGYDTYCWEALSANWSGNFDIYPATADPSRLFTREVVDSLGYPIERFAVLKVEDDFRHRFIRLSSIIIDANDIIQMSVSWRTRAAISKGGAAPNAFPIACMLLTADDGSYWAYTEMGDPSGPNLPKRWFECDSNFHIIEGAGGDTPFMYTPPNTSSISWTTVQFNQQITGSPAVKIPRSGSLQIILGGYSSGYGNPVEYWYKDLSVTILPYLQGSYLQLKGDYNYSVSNNNIKQTYSEDIEISDSPKRYFKGALLRPDGLSLATPAWKRAGKSESFRFTQLMERVMYNHLYRIIQKLEGTWRGLVYVPEDDVSVIRPNGYLCSYAFSDHDEPTKRFMLTSFEKNYATGQWRGVFIETLKDQNADGFVLPDTYKFSYVFQ